MASYQKFDQFIEDLANKVHNLNTDTLKVYLTNATPSASLDAVKADLAEISAGFGYAAGGVDVQNAVADIGSGTIIVGATDVTWIAAGGNIGPFRYIVLYNDTPTSPADPLIAWWDYGSTHTILDGNSFTIDFASNILLSAA